MLWVNPKKTINQDIKPKRYVIRPGSVLDVPRRALAGVRKFEEAMDEYFHKQANDIQLLLGMAEIYEIYKTDGIVDIQSIQGKFLKQRHERFVIDFIKENVEHLATFSRVLN